MLLYTWEIFVCFVESFLINYLFYIRIGLNKKYKYGFIISVLLFMTIVSILTLFQIDLFIKLFLNLLITTFLALYFYDCKRKWYKAIFWSCVYPAISTIADIITITIAEKIIDYPLDDLMMFSNTRIHLTLIYLSVCVLIVLSISLVGRPKTYIPFIASLVILIFTCIGVFSAQSIINIALVLRTDPMTIVYSKSLITLSYSVLVILVALMISFERLAVYFKKSKDLELHRQLSQIEKQHYKSIISAAEALTEWKHDYKGQLALIAQYIQQEDCANLYGFVRDMNAILPDSAYLLTSGNSTIDAIVSLRMREAYKRNIKFNHKLFIPEGIPLNDVSLSSLLGNILDNAIEACSKVSTDVRLIQFEITSINQKLRIFCKNSSDGKYNVSKKGVLLTTKKDAFHGIGTHRIQEITESVNGICQFTPEQSSFTVTILVPLEVDSFENSNSRERNHTCNTSSKTSDSMDE